MRNLLLVIRHEITSTVGKRSFWLTTFLFPLLILAFVIGPQLLASDAMESASASPAGGSSAGQAVGYVDLAGVVTQTPPSLPAGLLRAYPDVRAAQAAAAAGEIAGYYVIPADYLSTGKVTYLAPDVAITMGDNIETLIDYLLRYNLAGNEALASLLNDPTPSVILRSVAPQAVTPATPAGPQVSRGSNLGLPFIVMFVLFFVITMSASYMLQSVVHEKESRTAEVLLVSIRPRELMLGKVVGLGAVALAQMAIWIGAGVLTSGRGSPLLATGGAPLSPAWVIWAVLFFLGGYLVYSSALGAIGALAPNMREGSQFTFVALVPLLLPLWLNSAFLNAPNGTVATVLSLFPLSAPTAMVTRLAAGGVPVWQPFVALAGLALAASLFVILAARFFRADTLLSDRSLNWGRFAKEAGGKG